MRKYFQIITYLPPNPGCFQAGYLFLSIKLNNRLSQEIKKKQVTKLLLFELEINEFSSVDLYE